VMSRKATTAPTSSCCSLRIGVLIYSTGKLVPSWRQILDCSDWDASVGTHTVGQSGHPASEHFNDLFELWSTGRYHPLPYSRAAVEAAATSTMTLAP